MTREVTILAAVLASALWGAPAGAQDVVIGAGAEDAAAPAPATATAPGAASGAASATASAPAPGAAPAPASGAAPAADSVPPFTPPPVSPFTPTPQDVRDAHADRVVFMSTAYTHPAGTVYLSTYDIFLLQAGYALAEGTQITLTSTIPIEGLVLADLTLKSVIARDGPVRVAAMGSASGLWGLDFGNAVFGRAGAVAELCFDEGCRSTASMGASVFLGGPATLLGTGVGFIWRAASWLSVLAEFDTLLPMTPQVGKANGLALSPGLRLPFRTWSLDLAFAHPLGVQGAPTLPLLAFTYRFLR